MVVPCLSQAKKWSEDDIRIYEEMKKEADKIVYTSQEYTSDCMYKRNRHLVDSSSLCVCYMTKPSGGPAYTVNYAISKNLMIINIANL